MSGLEILAVAGVGVLVVTAAMLAAAETSITRVGLARAEALEEEGRRGAGLLRRLIERREQVLSPVLFVVLACHLGAATIVAVMVERVWGVGGVAIALAIELLVIYVVAEAIPKTFALGDPDGTATRLAPLVRALSLFAPLRWLTQGLLALARTIRPGGRREVDPAVLEEELLAVSQQALASEAIEPEEQQLIASIIDFGDTVAREVMVPRPDMVTVGQDFRVADVLEVVILNGFSRLPVSADTIDDIVGVVHAKDLMRAQHDGRKAAPVSDFMRPPIFVPETKRIAELMREMQAETFHIAIVVDEYGGTAGLLTLEDLIEELVGEIVDEFDVEQPMIEQIAPRQLRVNGRVPISALEEELDAALPEGDWDTVGGLIFNSLGHVPELGERLEVNGFAFTVERVNGRRIACAHHAERRGRAHDTRADSLSAPMTDDTGLGDAATPPGFRSGFVAFVGRPNAGKSTLLNKILGTKVAIVSDKPQTTRTQVRGVLNRPDAQIVFVDTPGIHKPRTALGERLNATAGAASGDVDVVCFVLDATAKLGRGDRFILDTLDSDAVVVVTKVDAASRDKVVDQLAVAGELDFSAYFPVSGVTGEGVGALVDHLVSRLPEGPRDYPADTVTDVPEAFWVAELVREQLLAATRQELPHSIAARVTEWEWPRIRIEIVVERDSQKGMVIGKGGQLLKQVGTAVREQLPEGAFVELHVTVDKDWQRRPGAIERLGY